MGKAEIMIDIANVEKIQEIIRFAYEAAEKILKISLNESTSFVTKKEIVAEMTALKKMIEGNLEEENKYIIEVVDENTVKTETCGDAERTMKCVLKNLDVIKGIVSLICERTGIEYERSIGLLVEELKSPLKGKIIEG